ncbi:adrenodoxin isoform X1 [Salmo salar]|uniref:Adrenodoxin isoform X1 n=1 Tax=Salmo salar TaxID=8030 RepID=A0ABM3DP67_SALSA|nr:adrenodoxin isoform X1 [Salmo salar]
MSVASASIQFFTRLLRYRTKCAVPFHAASRILISPYLPQVFGGNKVLLGTCAQPLRQSRQQMAHRQQSWGQICRDRLAETGSLRSEEKVTVYFINRDGRKITTSSAKGDSLLDLVVEQNLDIEGFGACEGTLACSTCHVILDQKVYNQLGPITDEENDMLDLAFGLTDTSRLGCQVCLSRDLEGITVRVPDGVNDMRRSDDAGPTL